MKILSEFMFVSTLIRWRIYKCVCVYTKYANNMMVYRKCYLYRGSYNCDPALWKNLNLGDNNGSNVF